MDLLQQDAAHPENAAFIKVIDPLLVDVQKILDYMPTISTYHKAKT